MNFSHLAVLRCFKPSASCDVASRMMSVSLLEDGGEDRQGGDVAVLQRHKFAIKKSYSIENGYPAHKRSLVDDARFETSVNKENRQKSINESENDIIEQQLLLAVGDDVTLDQPIKLDVAFVITVQTGTNFLSRIIRTFETHHGAVTHVETRAPRDASTEQQHMHVFVRATTTRDSLRAISRNLQQGTSVSGVELHQLGKTRLQEAWYPTHISELDLCNHLMTKFEPDLDMDHPGFADVEYRKRRHMIAQIAFDYRHGDLIPRIDYTADERATWRQVYKALMERVPTTACAAYRQIMPVLEKECGYSADNIPQLEEVSRFMQRRTGFRLRPAAGLLTARDFLASLAFRVFQCTQYVRHHASPHHSPEPDCIHELLGHAPLLAVPSFADFSQDLGLASLGASDDEIERFATMYWFTVEFGLCRERGQLRAYGAGLLSSVGELDHALSDTPEHRPFEPASTCVQPYQDQDYQDVYFVAESVEDVQNKFRQWVADNISRQYEVGYEPLTQRVLRLDSATSVAALGIQLKKDAVKLQRALQTAATR